MQGLYGRNNDGLFAPIYGGQTVKRCCRIRREDRKILEVDSKAKEVSPLAYNITDACINCGACDDACPIGAITEQGEKRVIDAEACTDCGACQDVCPVDAIKG
jgi:ferredoxin